MTNKVLKTAEPRAHFAVSDQKGRICTFIGGVFVPEDEEQAVFLLRNHPKEIVEGTAADTPGTIEELKDYQATQTAVNLDASQNVSEYQQPTLKPGNSATLGAVVAGVTPKTPTAIKVTTTKAAS